MCAIRNGRWLAVVSMVMAFALTGACAALSKNKNTRKTLSTAVEGFNTALRWGDFKVASTFVAPDFQEQFWRQSDIMEGRIRLTEYDIRYITWTENERTSPVIIRFRYYTTNDPTIQTETVRQVWRYNEQAQGWQLIQSGLDALMPR